MKKMIMLIGVAMVAAFANAASVEWSVSGLQADTGKTPASYSYIFLCDTTEAAIKEQLKEGTLTGGVSATSKTVRGTTTWSASGTSTTTTATGSTASGFLVILDSAAETYALLTKTAEVAESTGKATFTFAGGSTTIPSTATGHSAGTPEPTSGLLLLVGGAMLALRRRRA